MYVGLDMIEGVPHRVVFLFVDAFRITTHQLFRNQIEQSQYLTDLTSKISSTPQSANPPHSIPSNPTDKVFVRRVTHTATRMLT